jgi:hypothetical protein
MIQAVGRLSRSKVDNRASRLRWRSSLLVTSFLVVLTACGVVGRYQSAPLPGSCLTFEEPFFSAVTGTGAAARVVRSNVLRLEPDSAPEYSRGHREPWLAVSPVPFPVDSFTSQLWRSMSGWRRVSQDTLAIDWRNGLHGPVFRLALHGDSLVGSMIQTTDLMLVIDGKLRESPRRQVRALRTECPGPLS